MSNASNGTLNCCLDAGDDITFCIFRHLFGFDEVRIHFFRNQRGIGSQTSQKQ